MKLKSIIFGIIGLLLLLFIGTYSYYWGFTKISPEIQQCVGETVVHEKMTGDYAQSGTISDRVYQKLIDSHGITTIKGFCIYYDNPKTEKRKICVPMWGVFWNPILIS